RAPTRLLDLARGSEIRGPDKGERRGRSGTAKHSENDCASQPAEGNGRPATASRTWPAAKIHGDTSRGLAQEHRQQENWPRNLVAAHSLVSEQCLPSWQRTSHTCAE